MLLFRILRRYNHNLYAQTQFKQTANKCLYKEEVHIVGKEPRITIFSDIFVKIRALDMLEYPQVNVMKAQLYGTNCESPTAEMQIKIDESDKGEKKKVEIICTKLDEKSDFHCVLKLPYTSDVEIDVGGSVSMQSLANKIIKVQAHKNIHARNVRSNQIELISAEGDIVVQGFFAAEKTILQTGACGDISITRAQGHDFQCKTKNGNIRVESSYALSTKFTTDTGKIDLRNFHKKVNVFIRKAGELVLTSFNGIINATSNGGTILMDLIQIKGENIIKADEVKKVTVYISDTVEKSVFMKVTGCVVKLDSELCHLAGNLNEDKTVFMLSSEQERKSKLFIETKKADVKLGKIDWVKSMQIAKWLEK